MHFWVSAARPGVYGHLVWPRKMGTNWFMPALVNSRFGLSGMSEDEGTMVCCFDLKKSRKSWRICLPGRMGAVLIYLIKNSKCKRIATRGMPVNFDATRRIN